MPTPRKVVHTTWEELAKSVPVETNIRYTFVVYRHYTDVFELEDAHFHLESPILLPVPDRVPDDPEQPYITALGIIAQALKFAAEHPNQKLLVTAHVAPTNKPGASARAKTLSERRARNVLYLLKGDRKGWAETCQEKPRIEDIQNLLAFADRRHGFGCHPGAIDNQDSPALQQALDAFRAGYKRQFENTEVANNLSDTGSADAADFEAFFELYELCLAEKLETFRASETDPKRARAELTFVPPEMIGCGERWPKAWDQRPFRRTKTAHKAELLFIPDDEKPIPDLEKPEPAGAWLYRDQKRFMFQYYPVDPDPRVTCVMLIGAHFDTNKCFPLPAATEGMRRLVEIYADYRQGELLVVGHTDTSGEPDYNRELSLERAEAMVAYLKDDADAWLAHYDKSRPEAKRWGAREDQAMLAALPDGAQHLVAKQPWKSYQASRGLEPDGIRGPNTRKQLIADYMALDGTTLPEGITPIAHGCGEHFPLVDIGDGETEGKNRRVELFHFEQGVKPPPPAETSQADSTTYPHWRRAVVREEPLERHERVARFELRLGLDDRDLLPEEGAFKLAGGDYTVTIPLRDTAFEDAALYLAFDGVVSGARYTLTYLGPDDTSYVLFEEQNLDSYIRGARDQDYSPCPIPCAALPVVEKVDEDDGAIVSLGELTVAEPPRPLMAAWIDEKARSGVGLA